MPSQIWFGKKITIEGNPWQCDCMNEIFSIITKQAHHRHIAYQSVNNPYYLRFYTIML